ncbi:MAG: DHH family phosphoesterase [Promethearchaeota archaeon]
MLILKIKAILQLIKKKKILLLTHNSVDIDALASCFSFREFLINFTKISDVSIYFSEISKNTIDFLKKLQDRYMNFNFDYLKEVALSKYNIIFILDTNNINHVDALKDYSLETMNQQIIFIDHHFHSNNLSLDKYSIICSEYSSTSEIILEIYEKCKKNIPKPNKILLLAGLLTDSGFFKYGTNKTIINASKLVGKDINYSDVLSLLTKERTLSEKIAIIKGIQRVNLIRVKDFLIGVSHVGSYEAEVASFLIKNGFDVGIVLSEKKYDFRISMRAKKILCNQTRLNLGEILADISKKFNAHGGGHDGAASINGKDNHKELLNKIIERIKEYLNKA